MGIDPISIAIFAIVAISTAYQIVQAKKAAAKARKAAEARKGFEMPVEGEPGYLPIAYGRNKIGGYRAWHSTRGDYAFTTPNGDRTFETGLVNKIGHPYDYTRLVFNPTTGNYERQAATGTVTGGIVGYLNRAITVGGNNEFLFFQQALCLGPINKAVEVILDEGRYINDPSLGAYNKTETSDGKKTTVTAGFRADVHYNGGYDAVCAANFTERKTANFTDQAYASMVVRLNRDSPQFSGVPAVQFLIEGRKVRKVIGGVLQTTRVYTNNPAWCLLDYLLEPLAGKAMDPADIDLASFEAAAAICDTIVKVGATVGGKMWQPTDGAYFTTVRDIPLYECNMLVDTSKPHRENVETILSCMGDGRLIWSEGQYRLSLQYPADNASIVLADIIDDTRLVQAQEIQVAWPTAQERLNHCTVRFHNEFEQFKEDAVSWPPKTSQSYLRGVGGFRYGLPYETGYDTDKKGGSLLNNFGVWEGDADTVLLTWVFKTDPGMNASYEIQASTDDSGTFLIEDISGVSPVTLKSFSWNKWKSMYTSNVALGHATLSKVYKVTITGATNDPERKAVAMTLGNNNSYIWTTRSVSYSAFTNYTTSNAVYNTMMTEDGQVPLELEIFADTITDPYHALAKAEEHVRTSRTAAVFRFKYWVLDKFPEPGDFVKLMSTDLNLGIAAELFIRINSVKLDENGIADVTGTRFDWTQLAWNVPDDVYMSAPNLYDMRPPAPAEITYAKYPGTDVLSSGVLTCSNLNGWQGFHQYIWYAHFPEADPLDADGDIVFKEIGRTTTNTFILPALFYSSAFFGVRSVSVSGMYSTMTTTDLNTAIDLDLSWLNNLPWILTPVNMPMDDGLGNIPVNWNFDGGSHGVNSCATDSTMDWQNWVDATGGSTSASPATGHHMYQILRGIAGPFVLKFRIRGNAAHVMAGFSHSPAAINTTTFLSPYSHDFNTAFYQHPAFTAQTYTPGQYVGSSTDFGGFYNYDALPIASQNVWCATYSQNWTMEHYQVPPSGDQIVEFVYDGVQMSVFINNELARTYYGLEHWDTSLRYPTFLIASGSTEIYNIEWYRGTVATVTPTGWAEAAGSGRYVTDSMWGGGYWETTAPLSPYNDTLTVWGTDIKGGCDLEWTINTYANAFWTGGTHGGGDVALHVSVIDQFTAGGAAFNHFQDGVLTSNLRGDVHTDSWAGGDSIKVVYTRKKMKVWVNGTRIRNKKIGRNKLVNPYIEMPNYSKVSNIKIGRYEDDETYPSSSGAGSTALTSVADTTPPSAGAGVNYVEIAIASTVISNPDPLNPVGLGIYATFLYNWLSGVNYAPELKVQWGLTADGSVPIGAMWLDSAPTVIGPTSSSGTISTANINEPDESFSSGTGTLTAWARLVVRNSIAGAYTANIQGATISIQGFTTSVP
jgi:hypothetical protein